MPPIVVALADSVQKDRALERLVRSVSTSSATKRDRQRFHDAADQAADSLDIEAQPESEADNVDKIVAEYSGQSDSLCRRLQSAGNIDCGCFSMYNPRHQGAERATCWRTRG